MIIVHTFTSNNPQADAQRFALLLAVDRGYTSTIERDGSAVVVVASDGRAVRFEKEDN